MDTMTNKSGARLTVGMVVESSFLDTDGPVTIEEFGVREKDGQAVAILSDGQWAYVDELRPVR